MGLWKQWYTTSFPLVFEFSDLILLWFGALSRGLQRLDWVPVQIEPMVHERTRSVNVGC